MPVVDSRRLSWVKQYKAVKTAVSDGWIAISEKEVGFLDSVGNALYFGNDLSFKQSSWLRDIYNRIE
jgi:hypothetical protein